MQTSVETTSNLGRKLTVQLPAEQFDSAYDERLKSIARTAKIAGFRPGKVPLKVVKQRYGKDVEQEIISDLIQRSYGQAIQQEKLEPAGMPHIDAKPKQPGEGLEYSATFEVYPEVPLADYTKLKVEQPVAEIGQTDVDKMFDKLREQRVQWNAVERAAQDGDQVMLDFVGSIDGEPFEGGKGENVPLILGSKQMIPGFEDQLIGISAGEERLLNVTFPEDYGSADLQGKAAAFATTCKEVQEKQLPEMDEEFFKSFGAADGKLETLQNQLREHMQRELEESINAHTKKSATDGLLDLHEFELPTSMVDQEIQQLQQQFFQRMGIEQGDSSQLPREPYEEEASRRVKLGLIFAEIIKEKQFKADADKVDAKLSKIAGSYQNPEQMIQYYKSNREMLQSIQGLVIEDQVVEWLLEQAKIADKKMSFDELTAQKQPS